MPRSIQPSDQRVGDLFAASGGGGDGFGEDAGPFAAPTGNEGSMPLAARFRPRTLEEYVGQQHLLAEGKPLRRLIEADRVSSLIFFGPPGTGKTSLAAVIAQRTEGKFERLNAVEATVADLRRVLAAAALRQAHHKRKTVLFLDEIHRFNKAQQDVLLPDVESGTIRLIGATTHNPSFYINGPLVSRSNIFQLEPLTPEELGDLLDRALTDTERGLGKWEAELDPEARRHLITTAEGDARRALNGLELATLTTKPGPDGKLILRVEDIEACIQKKRVLYDRDEDQHYDTISAFIKSVRGSDPDSALYWLAKMVEAGEDPRFIARRLVILASEDIGLADPRGIMVAVAAHQAVEFIGWPEGRIPLAQATLYLATAPKSNSSIMGIDAALGAVRRGETIHVPRELRDAHYKGAATLGHGEGYLYSHDFPEGISPQTYGAKTGAFYQPVERGYERQIAERMRLIADLRANPGKATRRPDAPPVAGAKKSRPPGEQGA